MVREMSPRGTRSALGFLRATLLMLTANTALGHEMRPAFVQLTESAPNQYELRFHQPRVQDRYLNLQVHFSCTHQGELPAKLGPNSLIEAQQYLCPQGLDGQVLSIEGMDRTMTDALLRVVTRSGTRTLLIHPEAPAVTLTGSRPIPAYLALGMTHLLLGVDHVLFVLGLLYLVRGGWRLLRTVTSFTIAHSITLGLSIFGIVQISQALAEALIALTIVYVAFEIALGKQDLRHPGIIAFAFGLLHGLGFAGAMRDVGLPSDGLAGALLLFNIGIELGQIVVIGLVLLIVWLWHRSRTGSGRLATRGWVGVVETSTYWAPVYLMGSLAVYWTITRAAQLMS